MLYFKGVILLRMIIKNYIIERTKNLCTKRLVVRRNFVYNIGIYDIIYPSIRERSEYDVKSNWNE